MIRNFNSLPNPAEEEGLKQRALLFAICIAIFYCAWYGIKSFNLGDSILATINFSMVAIFALSGAMIFFHPDSRGPGLAIALTTAGFFFYLFVTGGTQGIGPIWSFILPLIVFFLSDFASGLAISLIYFFACILVFILNKYFPGISFDHSAIFIERFSGIYLLSAVVAGTYEFQRQKTESALRNLLFELKEAKEKAEKANQFKSSFIAMVSHEIRNPVNAINGMVELIQNADKSTQKASYYEVMRNSCNILLTLIKDILDLSRIESGRIQLEKTCFNLPLAIRETLERQIFAATAKNIELKLEIDESLPSEMIGDPTRLCQILTNLLDNAIKFTHQGQVLIKISAVRTTEASIKLKFDVIDTGIGIAPGKIEEIFENFSQAEPSIPRTYGGSGLGLAISKQLTELMGGEIGVTSDIGKGSHFYFSIFLEPAENK